MNSLELVTPDDGSPFGSEVVLDAADWTTVVDITIGCTNNPNDAASYELSKQEVRQLRDWLTEWLEQ
jgi:hypothetical protein